MCVHTFSFAFESGISSTGVSRQCSFPDIVPHSILLRHSVKQIQPLDARIRVSLSVADIALWPDKVAKALTSAVAGVPF